MKIAIDHDELYPHYFIDEDIRSWYTGPTAEVSQEWMDRYKRITGDWQELQDQLERWRDEFYNKL